jgi:alpha-beta hydrolase superfamily lysophospholipase
LDWLSYNQDNIRRYQESDLCGTEFTLGSYDALFRLVRDIAIPGLYHDVKEDLPILLISGEDDPCTGGEKGRKTSVDVLKKAGFGKLEVETIPHMRHEILNETDHELVYEKILTFLES